MVYNLRDKDKESTESSAVEEEVPNEPPNQEETGSEEGDIPANMDADLEQYLKNRGVCSSTMDALTKHGFTNWSLLQAMESGDPQDMEITTLAQRRILLKIAAEGPLPAPSPASIAPATPAWMQKGAAQGQGAIPGQGTASREPLAGAHAASQGGQAETQHTAPYHTNSPQGGCPGNHNLDPLAALGDQLAGLFTNIATPTPLVQLPQTQLPPGSSPGERVDLNPLNYLLPNQRAKFKDICDYVQESIDQQEEVVGRGEGTEFVVRTSIKKVKVEQVSPMQWSAANIRILMDLLREGELQPRGILDYLAYTIKVSSLATPYVWTSVLQWDRAYRRLQQQMGFRWGSDSPHLSSLYLLPRQPVASKKAKAQLAGASAAKNNVKPICHQYNKGECQYKEKCNFRHVCMIPGCEQPHPATQHATAKNP